METHRAGKVNSDLAMECKWQVDRLDFTDPVWNSDLHLGNATVLAAEIGRMDKRKRKRYGETNLEVVTWLKQMDPKGLNLGSDSGNRKKISVQKSL